MIITVRLFATYRSYIPKGHEGNTIEVNITSDTSVAELIAEFGIPLDNSSVILVNGRTRHLDDILKEGDVVSAFPAMAGG